jgi:xanthine dehydrogenase large subunit
LNGKAGQDAARQIKRRLADFAAATYGGRAEDVAFAADFVTAGGKAIAFPDLVQQAYRARVQLWSDGFYATPKLHWDPKTMSGRPFFYFAYGAAVSEVIVDTLTGEFKLLRADLLHDAGDSINPAIDIGQVEGAFIQGMGWLTTEELWWNKDGVLDDARAVDLQDPVGQRSARPTSRRRSIRNSNVEDTIHRSKATGRAAAACLPFSVFFAIRDAISSVGGHRMNPPLDAPATGESI